MPLRGRARRGFLTVPFRVVRVFRGRGNDVGVEPRNKRTHEGAGLGISGFRDDWRPGLLRRGGLGVGQDLDLMDFETGIVMDGEGVDVVEFESGRLGGEQGLERTEVFGFQGDLPGGTDGAEKVWGDIDLKFSGEDTAHALGAEAESDGLGVVDLSAEADEGIVLEQDWLAVALEDGEADGVEGDGRTIG